MPVGELSLKGPHNLMNSMAAALACLLAGCDADAVRCGLSDFPAVEHRLEPVRVWEGIEWINDSKATNVDSVYYALQSMTRPTVLILGGTDKGNDYSRIEPLVREKVKAIVCMGVDNSRIVEAFSSTGIPMEQTCSIGAAIEACRRHAEKGDTVLLSPACASFDLFRNYEDRGRQFKECVGKL